MPTVMGKVHCTVPHLYEGQYPSSTMPIDVKNTMIMVEPTAHQQLLSGPPHPPQL